MWRQPLPLLNILPGTAFELLLYISGVLSSHPFIIYHVYLYALIIYVTE